MDELLATHRELVEEFATHLGVRFERPELLLEAMIHKSFANEQGLDHDNERLEFLGDAIIGASVADYLIRHRPEAREGELAKLRSSLVSRDALATAAEALGLAPYLLLGKGAQREPHGRAGNLADFFEAVVGAIYLEAGYARARSFVRTHLIRRLFETASGVVDYKSELQAYTLEAFRKLPKYRLVQTSGPVHDRWYVVEVEVNGRVCGRGEGRSKKQAQKLAAKAALDLIRKEGGA